MLVSLCYLACELVDSSAALCNTYLYYGDCYDADDRPVERENGTRRERSGASPPPDAIGCRPRRAGALHGHQRRRRRPGTPV